MKFLFSISFLLLFSCSQKGELSFPPLEQPAKFYPSVDAKTREKIKAARKITHANSSVKEKHRDSSWTLTYTHLSNEYNYCVTSVRKANENPSGTRFPSDSVYSEDYDYSVIAIIEKSTGKVLQRLRTDNIIIAFEGYFRHTQQSRSYLTHFKDEDNSPSDGEYGDFIVADFNFDGCEDFALVTNYSVDAGPRYSYFVSQPGQRWKEDTFLSDEGFFPVKIDSTTYTITTLVHASAYSVCKHIYKYNERSQTWIEAYWRIIDYDPN